MEGGENETWNKMAHKTREMNMERFLLLFHKFGFHTGMIAFNRWVIIIGVLRWNFCSGGSIVALQRNAFCTDAKSSWIVRNWIVWSQRTSSCCDNGIEVTMPLPVPVSVFSAQPSYKVSIDKIEAG